MVGDPPLSVNGVQRLLHGQTTLLQHVARGSVTRVLHQQLPVNHVVPRDRLRVREARVLHHARVELLQQHGGVLHGVLQLRLVRFVGINAQKHVLPPHEAELRRGVVEPRDLEDVSHTVTA